MVRALRPCEKYTAEYIDEIDIQRAEIIRMLDGEGGR
jgi:hypothetical protein